MESNHRDGPTGHKKCTQTEEGSCKKEAVDDILMINVRKVDNSTEGLDIQHMYAEINMLNNKLDSLMGMFNDIPPLSLPIYDSIIDIDVRDFHAILNAILPLDGGSKAPSKTVAEIFKIT